MKYLKRFNEAILDYKSENIDGFYKDVKDLLDTKTGRMKQLTEAEAKSIGDKNGVEVVDYDTFLSELPESEKSTAPPRHVPAFALVNPVNHKPRVVLNKPIDERLLEFIYHMLKHENIHIKQHAKRPNYKKGLPDPKDQKAYFSDYDEVMAYSQSVVDQLMGMFRPRTLEEGVGNLGKVQLYNDISKAVDMKTLKKYRKYIYLYLEKELESLPPEPVKKEEPKVVESEVKHPPSKWSNPQKLEFYEDHFYNACKSKETHGLAKKYHELMDKLSGGKHFA